MSIPDVEKKIEALKAAKATINQQIEDLKDYSSPAQLSVWRRRVREINVKIKYREEQLNKLKLEHYGK